MGSWIELCERPRERPPTLEWDVFISYRSADRVWATALYDTLAQCGYSVFLDQYVLVAGDGLPSQLGTHLRKSASGVLVWSKRTVDSKWVEKEFNAMSARESATAGDEFPFYFVMACLDDTIPPGLEVGQLYLDFSSFPDGPMGVDLVRLTCGLQGKPLSPAAVRQLLQHDAAMRQQPQELRALAAAEDFDSIVSRLRGDDLAYTTLPTLPALGIELLVRARRYADALALLETLLQRFPGSLRLRQLQGLALRRTGDLKGATYRLNLLKEEGHRDPETLGMLAAVHADAWELRTAEGDARAARDALEQSRNLYLEGFARVPTDTYSGINAASKSALLGDVDQARTLADRVLERLRELQAQREGEPSSDYWERVTEPEALLLKGDWEQALRLYRAARVAHQQERGSIESTAKQVERLLGVLDVPQAHREALAEEFGLRARG